MWEPTNNQQKNEGIYFPIQNKKKASGPKS